ncbi:13914_t:CDS:2, partial [Cetraspora pellucida]
LDEHDEKYNQTSMPLSLQFSDDIFEDSCKVIDDKMSSTEEFAYDIDNYNTDDDEAIEILINQKKKEFHSTCSIMILNPLMMTSEMCNKPSTQRLWNLIGNWKINSTCIKEVGDNPEKLEICESHFNLDQASDFHPTGSKQNIDHTSAMISYKRCLYCNYNFHVFTRERNCKTHAWYIIGKDIMLPYITLYTCNALMTHKSIIYKKLSLKKNYHRSRYICQTCFSKNGGHTYIPSGQGKKRVNCIDAHNNENGIGLRIIENWILNIGLSSDKDLK